MTSPGGRSDSGDGGSRTVEAVSFDLFGTLVIAERPADPATAVGVALRDRDVDLPADWTEAYRTSHVDVERGHELALSKHVLAVLRDAGVGDDVDETLVREALLDAFDAPIRTREGAVDVVTAVAERVPVAILSNSSVPGLVSRTVRRSSLPQDEFVAVLASVDVGWRKPWPGAFEAVAAELGVELSGLLHVGDDPRTDGGAERSGARSVIVERAGPLEIDAIDAEVGWPQ